MGKILGKRWEIIEPLGEGGQGITYLVKDAQSPGSKAVLKRLKNTKRMGRFKREVEAILKLDHGHIMKLIESNFEGSEPYLVSHYYSGGTLERIVAGGKIPTVGRCLKLFIEIADAINHAHSQKVVHRDIKPSNIFLAHEAIEYPIIGDFGLCYFTDNEEERHTETAEAVGARFFMAPESEDGRMEDVTPSVDVYSLGKLLYWLVSGGRRFSREKTREPRWNLTNIMPHDYLPRFNPAMEHINRLLDMMIVHEPANRATLPAVIMAARRTARLVELDFNPVGKGNPQHCRYCGWGEYQVVADGNGSDAANMGLNLVGSSQWLILACNKCGHLQHFRKDLAEDKKIWER